VPVFCTVGLLAAFAAVAPPAARAHDFWIEPSTFHPAVGEDFSVALRVGERFEGEPVPRDDRRIRRFFLVSRLGEAPIPGLPGTDPAGFGRLDAPGVVAIGYRSDRSPVLLEAAKFEQYLADQGLESVSKERRRRGESSAPGREVFSRSAKSLLYAEPRGPDFDRRLGLTFEILLQSDPAKRDAGPVRFRLLYEDKPLSGALVKAICREEPGKPPTVLTARSGRDGNVAFVLPRPGVWLIEAVHMVPAPKDAGADWESTWASLTLEIR
jgi:uncharacterized GH25 family protein